MDQTRNITPQQTKASAPAQPAAKALPQNDILAFLNLFAAKTADAKTASGTTAPAAGSTANAADAKTDLTAKITALLNANPAEAQKLQNALQPGATGATRTSDLASQLATLLQAQGQANPDDVMQQLQTMFGKLTGMSAGDLEGFRNDAIKLMKNMGMSDKDIESTLRKFAATEKLNKTQTAALTAPIAAAPIQQAIANPGPAKADDKMDTANSLGANSLGAKPAANGLPQSSQPNTAADAQAPRAAADAQAAAVQAPAPQAKTDAATQPTNMALINQFSSDSGSDSSLDSDSNSGGNNGGSYMADGSLAAQQLSGVTSAATASAESFANYMNNTAGAGAATTTQMVALQIQKNMAGDVNTFTMQLNPAELGGLEVRLKFGKDGSLKAHLIADKPETLNMLQKDSGELHRMLASAGIDADDSSLSFDLRQQNRQQDSQQSAGNARRGNAYGADLDDMISSNAIQAKLAVASYGSIRQGGVNIMV